MFPVPKDMFDQDHDLMHNKKLKDLSAPGHPFQLKPGP